MDIHDALFHLVDGITFAIIADVIKSMLMNFTKSN